MQFTRNLRVIFNFTLRVITRNVTVTYRNVTGLYNPIYGTGFLGRKSVGDGRQINTMTL